MAYGCSRRSRGLERSDEDAPLARDRGDRIVAGVCAGIARWIGWDAWVVRMGFLVTAVFGAFFPVALIYALLWFVLPVRPCRHRDCRRASDLDEILGDDWDDEPAWRRDRGPDAWARH